MYRVAGIAGSVTIAATLFLCGCSACSPRQNPDELRERTAKTTAMLKQDAKAIAQGVREGMSRNDLVNLNSATQKQLTALPGITDEQASKIIANRPYAAPDELVVKRVLSRRQYNNIRDRVTVRK
jgi:DNA uptake protein ComE-like DNA-binding protein